ncbi:chromosome partitioning protein ParA [Pseudoalteromonas sp. L23]|uniref:chromosome partitioning protein ParA n=1 Tax=unclassified Pseudoalteromonas TaxID=194690 RepID=UPI001EEFB684|nr:MULTISPECIES: chromosome partitioning protein ParA [unclassified Pseudoalteromonas]MCF7515665.1 chromosome partitioning protein ParA [Pseudoalteromonas sp. L7]MCF7527678.1 chromosome partitioning protein ParA [Pseudoalteromonas sp. L23]MCX2767991.1 chromosome partitioning protein ParA [Pseudoalteromonas sp. B530]
MFLGKLPIDVFIYMAVNIGLLILAFWFYILLLILREFRLFAKAAGGAGTSNPEQQYLLQHCREAINKSMKFVEDNQHTIQELANLQVHLEQQLAEVKRSTQDHISTEEQTRMDDLNSKLLKSHRLIKKLRGDLSKSLERLKQTRRKLYDQYESTEELQKENDTLKQQLEASKAMGGTSEQELEQLVATFEKERQDMSLTINEYKRQIAEQNQALQQLMVQEQEVEDGPKLQAIQKELEQTREALEHLSKEKKFIESRYLEVVKNQTK